MLTDNIENFMKLATNCKGTPEAKSKEDSYYQHVYERKTFQKQNKAALFLSLISPSTWFFYRKMYVEGTFVFLFKILLYWLLFSVLKVTIIGESSILIVIAATVSLIGNGLYVANIRRKISKGYHLCSTLKNTDNISVIFNVIAFLLINLYIITNNAIFMGLGMLSIFFLFIWVIFVSLIDKKKVKMALTDKVLLKNVFAKISYLLLNK